MLQKHLTGAKTYKFIINDLKEPLAKYKEILNNNLQVEISAIKEIELYRMLNPKFIDMVLLAVAKNIMDTMQSSIIQ